MLKQDLIQQSQLVKIGNNSEDFIAAGRFGAVLARAGVGKTAFIVQLAMNAMLRDKPVLHISLDHPVDKVKSWYKEVFQNLVGDSRAHQSRELWQSILPNRFIMTFKVEGFSVPKLEERLTDLVEQKIFIPQVIIVDGLPFDAGTQAVLAELKTISKSNDLVFWFTVKTHREEAVDTEGFPPQLSPVIDFFDIAVALDPKGDKVQIKSVLKPADGSEQPDLCLDPVTKLVKPVY